MIAPLRAALLAGCLLVAGPALAEKKPLGPADRIYLNRASAGELMRLPGVGQRRAQAILAQRARQPFRRVEDLLQVKGFGAKWLGRVRPHLQVTGGAPAAPPPRK